MKILLAFAALLVASLAAAQPAGLGPKFQTDALGDGLYAFRYGPYRDIFVVGDQGVIATDPLSSVAAAALKEEIAKVTDLRTAATISATRRMPTLCRRTSCSGTITGSMSAMPRWSCSGSARATATACR